MPRAAPLISTFNAGEWSPEMAGRLDIARYANASRVMENFIPLAQGPATRRPGTRFIAEAASAEYARLIPFEFSTAQAYVVEASNLKFRFFMNQGIVRTGGGAVYELATPYTAADLPELKWAQSADTMYLVHPRHPPRKLTRTGHADWTITAIEFKDGPYLDQNILALKVYSTVTTEVDGTDSYTLRTAPEAVIVDVANVGGKIRIKTAWWHEFSTGMKVKIALGAGVTWSTASTVWPITVISKYLFELDGAAYVAPSSTAAGTVRPALFAAGDVGRSVRFKARKKEWAWGQIEAFIDETEVKFVPGDMVNGTRATTEESISYSNSAFWNMAIGTATPDWRLGAWWTADTWPSCVTFHEERLFFANSNAQPQTIWATSAGDYENFAPTEIKGLVLADNAITATIADDRVNAIRWLSSGRTLAVGTTGGEFSLQAATAGEPITPDSVVARRDTTRGVANILPVRVGQAVLFVQRARRRLYEMAYSFEADSQVAPEMTMLASHVTRPGIKELAYQAEPWNVLWCCLDDGALAGMTYMRDQQVVAWHRHPLPRGKVISLASIPAAANDELWLVVERIIGGERKLYVEVLGDAFQPQDKYDLTGAGFLDSALTYDPAQGIALTPAAATGTNVLFTADGAVFESGMVGRELRHAYADGSGRRRVARARIATHVGATSARADIITAFPSIATIPAGAWGVTATTLDGLDHLEGETVQILADGATHADRQIVDGSVTLAQPAARVQVGFGYASRLETMNVEGGAADGTSQGRTRRIHKVAVRLVNTVGGRIGAREGDLESMPSRVAGDPMDLPPPLYAGDRVVAFPTGWTDEARVLIVQDQPLPMTVAALMPRLSTSDS